MAESIKERKSSYRKQLKKKLGEIPAEDVERQSKVITEKALNLDEYKHANSLSIFLAMPGREISTNDIVLQAFRDGKKVFVPYIHVNKGSKSKTMDMLRLHNEDDLNSLQPDTWGIPTLSADSLSTRENAMGGYGCLEEVDKPIAGSASLDLIFMPAMAFDKTLNRLGHGKGFYDRYLTKCRQRSLANKQKLEMPHLVGLALREQLIADGEELPTTHEDWKVDIVVSADP